MHSALKEAKSCEADRTEGVTCLGTGEGVRESQARAVGASWKQGQAQAFGRRGKAGRGSSH